MNTKLSAAILLLTGTILISQSSLARPPTVECELVVEDSEAACTSEIGYAFKWLGNAYAAGVFATKNGEQNYIGLTCKLALSQVKMEQEKAEDAYYKLSDSAAKVDTLLDRGKLNTGDDRDEIIGYLQSKLNDAATCAYDEAFN